MKKLNGYTFWFIVGSQDLYGEEVLNEVNKHSLKIVNEWNDDSEIPCTIEWKPVVCNREGISKVIAEANMEESCAGIITWMHTFSPSKMWIQGFKILKKPLLHINTQFNKEIPWGDIDMDFMNLNQSAHGDREHGFITARMRIPHKVICGHWQDSRMKNRVSKWMRAAIGATESQRVKVMRISDNMRDVAVTEGDKVEAEIKFGWQVDHYGVGDIISYVDKVTEKEIDEQMNEYMKKYDMDHSDLTSIKYQAKLEVAIEKFMQEHGGYNAFHTNFQDLQQLEQLPGLAAQDLMFKGYGFAAEGDWKTAALCRIMKMMSQDKSGGTSFIEDYTYDFCLENGINMGSHMLEICPSLACEKPKIKVFPLGIGNRNDPARLTFKSKSGDAILVTIVDMGDRFRMVIHDVVCIDQEKEMPKLPVANVLWKPLPNFETGSEAWIYSGGAHHSVLTYDLDADILKDFADIMDIECIHINKNTSIDELQKELLWHDLVWKLKK